VNEFFGKKGEKPSENPQPKGNPKPIPFHCDHYERDGHLKDATRKTLTSDAKRPFLVINHD
jgi:hypothetical protein